MTENSKRRVLYQSFTDPAHHGAYLARLDTYLKRIASPGIQFEIRGMRPADVDAGRLGELRCGVQSVAGVIEAEREGFDAVLIGHFQDAALYEAKTAVDIPVVGYGEAAMLQATLLGSRIGILTIDRAHLAWKREQIRRYGLESRVVGIRSIEMTPAEAARAFDDRASYEAIRERYLAEAERLVADHDVDVVLSAGGLFGLLSADDPELQLEGVAFANSTLLAVKQLEASLAIHDASSSGRSRTFAKATPRIVDEFTALVEAGSVAFDAAQYKAERAQEQPVPTQPALSYTASATADGNGRNGRVRTSDGALDVELRIPEALGGKGGGSNPEQLIASGYAGCFMSALDSEARKARLKLVEPSVNARVTIAMGENGFELSAHLTANLPGLDRADAAALVEAAHKRCPVSKALKGGTSIRIDFDTALGSGDGPSAAGSEAAEAGALTGAS
ncbi:Ohr family peroxiredoxin [Ruicaihuangia caeni]|uniref:Ohr family peroxiredoxin n=1 Tax=Ruicaihuangia caeni TaxID=3042517 RepID=A0AAW6T5H9_9MICO|nr:Ohr family peroxiredoxin [Klugiella sp. YN-L-19]MDI2099022.1 Ohr family peroxiredoxin [Klugiella sp. YN-L-19]